LGMGLCERGGEGREGKGREDKRRGGEQKEGEQSRAAQRSTEREIMRWGRWEMRYNKRRGRQGERVGIGYSIGYKTRTETPLYTLHSILTHPPATKEPPNGAWPCFDNVQTHAVLYPTTHLSRAVCMRGMPCHIMWQGLFGAAKRATICGCNLDRGRAALARQDAGLQRWVGREDGKGK
jgi:hypothetical protein